jgi:hypothetical protein
MLYIVLVLFRNTHHTSHPKNWRELHVFTRQNVQIGYNAEYWSKLFYSSIRIIAGKPRFVKPPADTSLLAGWPSCIEWSVSTVEQPAIAWYKNGKVIYTPPGMCLDLQCYFVRSTCNSPRRRLSVRAVLFLSDSEL